MAQPNRNPNQLPVLPIRQTEIKTWLTDETMSPLGRELMKIARQIEASDDPALSEAAIEQELLKRKGGYLQEDGE